MYARMLPARRNGRILSRTKRWTWLIWNVSHSVLLLKLCEKLSFAVKSLGLVLNPAEIEFGTLGNQKWKPNWFLLRWTWWMILSLGFVSRSGGVTQRDSRRVRLRWTSTVSSRLFHFCESSSVKKLDPQHMNFPFFCVCVCVCDGRLEKKWARGFSGSQVRPSCCGE